MGAGARPARRAGGIHYALEGVDRDTALRALVRRLPLADEAERELVCEFLLAREALGPTGIALVTDYVFRNDLMLRYSILVVSALAGLLAALCLTYNLRQYRKAVAESASWSAAPSGAH